MSRADKHATFGTYHGYKLVLTQSSSPHSNQVLRLQSSTELLIPYMDHVYIITADNGRAFAGHETIAKKLEADVSPRYFAHPYSSWEHGAALLRNSVK